MRRSEDVVLMNMCMVYDENGNILVQERVHKDWSGITFPGGHVEKNEAFIDSVIREVYEESGLTIVHPKLCGIKQWSEDDIRYVVVCYKTNEYTGTLTSSSEGAMYWISLEEFKHKTLASGMEYMIEVFTNEAIQEHYIEERKDEWMDVLK